MTKPALSTMWGMGRFGSLGEFLAAADALGFGAIELNYQFTEEWRQQLVSQNSPSISGLHDPCPWAVAPGGTPAHRLKLSSLDEEERRTALYYAKGTIRLAGELGASYVILHMGSVGDFVAAERSLRPLYALRQRDTAEYRQTLRQVVAERARLRERYFSQAMRSLAELVEYARDFDLVLALESRLYYHEIPQPEEMERMLAEFGSAVGYWHDTGHAEIQSRLGFRSHEEWLERFADRLVGVHLHDVDRVHDPQRQGEGINWLTDHLAPGAGFLDWGLLARHLPEGVHRVLELNNANPEPDVRRAVPLLRERGVLPA